MPIKRNSGESKDKFISRCMSAEADKFPDEKQRYAVCIGYWGDAVLQDCNSGGNNHAMSIKFLDKAKIGTVKRTQEGYLIARSRVARTGIQEYLARELGDIAIADGFDPDDVVKVYRPPEEVFSDEALKSLTRAPVTIDHPPELVDADNWSKYAVGEIGDQYKIEKEDGWIAVDPMIKDASAVKKTETTHKEWSMGYVAQLRKSRISDAHYEMYDIRFNHIAAVPRGRAGSQARIGDGAANQWGAAPLTTANEVPDMEMKAVAIGDKAIQVAATDADTLKAVVTAKDNEIEQLKANLAAVKIEAADAAKMIKTDEQINALVADGVADLVKTIEKAKTLVAGYDASGKTAMEVKRDVIAKVYGDEAIADLKSDAEINAAFKVARSTTVDTARAAIGDAMKGKETAKGKSPWDEIIKKKEAK